jgi:hypothetical protein
MQFSLPCTNLTNMQRTLEMRHLRVYPQRIQIRKTLPTVLARVAEIPLVHTFHVRAVRPPAGQHLSALGAGLWFGLARTGRLFQVVHLPSVPGEVLFILQIQIYISTYSLPPPPQPQASLVPPPLGPKGETHSLAGEGVGGPNSDERTDTLVRGTLCTYTILPQRSIHSF